MKGPKKPPPNRLLRYLLCAGALVPLLLAVGIWRANPPFPATPELDAVSLELSQRPASPPSAALEQLLRSRTGPGKLRDDPDLRRAIDTIHGGDRLENLERVETALEGVDLAGLRKALRAPGCIPVEQPRRRQPMRTHYLHLVGAVKLLVLDSVVQTQRGRPAAAAAELRWLTRRLALFEGRCNAHLLGVVVATACIDELLAGLRYPMAHPALSDEGRAGLFTVLRTLEARPNPMPTACRREGQWIIDMTALEGEEENTPWPWYDPEETRRYLEIIARRGVWMAELSLASRDWARPCPEHEYFKRLASDPGWLSILRYNAAGKVLLGISMPGVYRNRILRWHRSTCMAGARRALWSQQIRQRGFAVPAAATDPPPRDRFAGKAFGSITPEDEVCAFTRRHVGKEGSPGGGTTPSLPPVPDADR